MKSRLQLLLLFVAFAGVIYGASFLMNYNSTETEETKPGQAAARSEPPLKFFTLNIAPGVGTWRYWNGDVEVHGKNRADFWCQNRHDRPVTVSVPSKNCQCTTAEIGVVDAAALDKYLRHLAVGAFVPGGASLWNALAVPGLAAGVAWKPLNQEGTEFSAVVPAAVAGRPTDAIIRLNWVGKGDASPRTIAADVAAKLPDSTAAVNKLMAKMSVVPSFLAFVPGSKGTVIDFGELGQGSSAGRDVIIWSATRSGADMSVTLSGGDPEDPCFQFTKFEPLPQSDLDMLGRALSQPEKPVTVKCGYRLGVTVHESREAEVGGKKIRKSLDMGPFDRRLAILAGTDPMNIPIRGMVRGSVHVIGGPTDTDKIDLGSSFPNNQDRVKEVTIYSDLPDHQLEVAKGDLRPAYLDVKLDPLPPRDGRPQWKLRVRVPAGKLFGGLPQDSVIVLQSKDDAKRKIRIPVTGAAFTNPF